MKGIATIALALALSSCTPTAEDIARTIDTGGYLARRIAEINAQK
ncbi:hypothetical protein [Roseibacillus ishigakijimensis]|nr:hypothetical protein [Roseibacillus ishigakijimensis]